MKRETSTAVMLVAGASATARYEQDAGHIRLCEECHVADGRERRVDDRQHGKREVESVQDQKDSAGRTEVRIPPDNEGAKHT